MYKCATPSIVSFQKSSIVTTYFGYWSPMDNLLIRKIILPERLKFPVREGIYGYLHIPTRKESGQLLQSSF